MTSFPKFSRIGHAGHVNRCLTGLPASQVEAESTRMAVGFYCLGTLDLLGALDSKTTDTDRKNFREWIWEQQTHGPNGSGFRPSPFATPDSLSEQPYGAYNGPHLVMTYTALLTLAILRDDFLRLDRKGLIKFMRSCQKEDGSFSIVPGFGESDLRTIYCAFSICHMLEDWSGIDVPRALNYIETCRSYEGGYGQNSFCEASGGPTYIALASIHLARPSSPLTAGQRSRSIHWLIHNQHSSGGFRGRTGKEADACYSFWCGASLKILDAEDLVDSNAQFIASCQFKYGGIAKTPGHDPDPYHTYLSIAALSLYPPHVPDDESTAVLQSWKFGGLDPLLNATTETVAWIRAHVPSSTTGQEPQ
ncbi:Terpenoid cyclases/Protein prenyltransferase [Mycena indigotica]|uniref:Terpenoid cyclases/Protein prenyltransferase n=1 Tax=Mycena indigotica TaxID=2126181 RepID=A0A8H6T2K1_9AGAR|nr:Terpenoid cyclases/Protein prenyltransferase [Mycena indigotica]KAF7309818.1 Terpenoid cyclases/Protein prenyltransferase [Mycena indigotica]